MEGLRLRDVLSRLKGSKADIVVWVLDVKKNGTNQNGRKLREVMVLDSFGDVCPTIL